MPAPADHLQSLWAIQCAIATGAFALDARDYDAWLGQFLPDAPYAAITAENLALSGPNLFMDFGIDGRKERVAFWLGLWQVGRARTRHIIGQSVLVDTKDGAHRVATPFLIARTGSDGVTQLHCSATYNDDWVETPDGWRLAFRRVVVDCDILPANFTDPL